MSPAAAIWLSLHGGTVVAVVDPSPPPPPPVVLEVHVIPNPPTVGSCECIMNVGCGSSHPRKSRCLCPEELHDR